MRKSDHFNERSIERAISETTIKFVLEYGEYNETNERCILNKKSCKKLLASLNQQKSKIHHLMHDAKKMEEALQKTAMKTGKMGLIFRALTMNPGSANLKKSFQKEIENIDKISKEIQTILKKGGVTVVVAEGNLITTFRTDSYKRRKRKKGKIIY